MTKARDNATQGGLVLLNKTDFTTASNVQVNNVFSSTYTNYMAIIHTTSASAAGYAYYRFASGGTVDTGNNHEVRFYTNLTAVQTGTTSAPQFNYVPTASNTDTEFLIFSPYATEWTRTNFRGSYGNIADALGAGVKQTTTQYDGILFSPASGTFTGTLRIYGIRN